METISSNPAGFGQPIEETPVDLESVTNETFFHPSEPKIEAWLQEDIASLIKVCDRVFGFVSGMLALATVFFWFQGKVGLPTLVLVVSFPVLNLGLSWISTTENRIRVEIARLVVNVPLTGIFYAVADGVMEKTWLLSLIMVTGNALSWPVFTRRASAGYFVTLCYVASLFIAGFFDESPHGIHLAWRMISLFVVGVVLSAATAALGDTAIEARQKREEAETHKKNLERSLQCLSETQGQLVTASRLAGIAEVATGVLHNVGNVLNSVNVSSQVVSETLGKSKLNTLSEVARLLEQHQNDLATFLTEDQRGRNLVPLVLRLSERLESERSTVLHEHGLICERIEHIRAIVSSQQENAKMSAMVEECTVPQLIDEAVALMLASYGSHGIKISRSLGRIPPIVTDRHRALQILINLLANAKDAANEAGVREKKVTITSGLDDERVWIAVADNGCGIIPENLQKVFAHGFTTKKQGHGFGLHNSSNAAREMGGELLCKSAGPGQGAEFTLVLPLRSETSG